LQKPEPGGSLANSLACDRQVLGILVKSDELADLDDGDLPAPFEARASGPHGHVGVILSLPIGTDKKNITADDHGAVMDAAAFDLLREPLFNLDVWRVFETFVLGNDRSERHPNGTTAKRPENEPADNTWRLYGSESKGANLKNYSSTHHWALWLSLKTRHDDGEEWE
jgi:hypothetical protein